MSTAWHKHPGVTLAYRVDNYFLDKNEFETATNDFPLQPDPIMPRTR